MADIGEYLDGAWHKVFNKRGAISFAIGFGFGLFVTALF